MSRKCCTNRPGMTSLQRGGRESCRENRTAACGDGTGGAAARQQNPAPRLPHPHLPHCSSDSYTVLLITSVKLSCAGRAADPAVPEWVVALAGWRARWGPPTPAKASWARV